MKQGDFPSILILNAPTVLLVFPPPFLPHLHFYSMRFKLFKPLKILLIVPFYLLLILLHLSLISKIIIILLRIAHIPPVLLINQS